MTCIDERRRVRVRASRYNGIDGIDVHDDRVTLTVIFFGKAPEELEPVNFRIDGGRRIVGIEVTGVELCAHEDPELEDRVRLTVDRPGDRSTYRLCVVEAGPGTAPYPGFDPRYACAEFTFFPDCADLDCKTAPDRPQERVWEPEIDYLAKDYASFRRLLLDRLSLTMPAWTERHVPDIGIALVELLAYEGDRLSYRQDAVATEAYLDTARRRVSVRRHAQLVDYAMHDGCAARSWVCLETSEEITLPAGDFRFVTLPPGVLANRGAALLASDLDQRGIPAHEVFEPVHHEPVVLRPAHNMIQLWTWGDHGCCLPAGATSATLVDGAGGGDEPARELDLAPGDVLLFEELRGPRTGAAADADLGHRQAVRLTAVTEAVDELYRQPVLEVTWDRADALTFPLCVNARGGPDCTDLTVGVARGNVVLVEHGRGIAWCGGPSEAIEVPEPPPGAPGCPDPVDFGCPDDVPGRRPAYPPIPIRFRPELGRSPVTQSAPFPAGADLATAQARRLRGLPERTRRRLTALWRRLRNDDPSQEDIRYLAVLFGQGTLRKVRFDADPRQAVRTLLIRFDELLAVKLARLADLIRRARAGYVLGAGESWEIAQTWGRDEGDGIGAQNPAFRGPAALATRPDPRAALPVVEVTDRYGRSWRPRRTLLDSGPADRHFVGEVDDDGGLTLRFGDGRTGASYPLGGTLHARYRVGNGTAGNVGREAINRIVFCRTRQTGIRLVRNPLPATGGTDPEPVAEVRLRAPGEARRRLLRALTAADYATLAGQVPGVQRAAADLRWTGSWYEAQIAVDPLGTGRAPDWLLDEVRESMYRYRRIGHDLSVATAVLVPLDIALRVEVDPAHITGHVRAALLRLLGAGRDGLFHPDRLTFGTAIRVSALVAAAAGVPGVRHVEVTRLQRLFGPRSDALETGVLPIGALEVAQLDNDPSRPEDGLLTLAMGGGR
ncbi:MAG TPA: putative baseplate assembly protein [Actinophytocola sp.]|uniref:putative baseplate assembly protein n=1 Tax=Actinophytocola sp. TaxID=1872138 RepID=UPI002DDCCD6D|nr:putative baseplate assembly protein [Actinophytocola sp.]HEV2777791.1 putative baseplate assembly protein [Actinophytocola sp.]